ncbi:hypothetical protein AOQ84DRAFT_352110 [Glonium stellatum]|uniref:HMG box domain-containing protein n=1 Tax=Glonium stellatum TaxID=574774 RepID=A0A8E2FA82_9PEZI|nr:hypothetical protein AOQ84DRAFT_352110 [Glonium stellatum]
MAATTPRTKAKPAKPKPSATAGVKRGLGRPPKGTAKNGTVKATVLMQNFFKEHRSNFPGLSFREQQKELGKMWKTAPENPKNS